MSEFIGVGKKSLWLHVKKMAKSLHVVDDMSKKEINFDMSVD